MTEYAELTLELRARGDEVAVSGRFEGVDVSAETLVLPFNERDLDGLPDTGDAFWGETLSQALFVGAVVQQFAAARHRVRDRSEWLLLRLRFMDPQVEWLQRLPWELAWEPGTTQALGLSSDIVLVRDVARRVSGRSASPPTGEPRLLVVVGAFRSHAPLDVSTEVAALRALEDRGWSVEVEVGDLSSLNERLGRACRSARPFDVVHFLGHGQAGELAMVAGGREEGISGAVLRQQRGRLAPPSLVVLNACDTATAAADVPRATAVEFLENAASSVLAMASPIPDDTAVTFSRVFYPVLAKTRNPAEALHTARLAIQAESPATNLWSIPVAYGAWRPWGAAPESPPEPTEAPARRNVVAGLLGVFLLCVALGAGIAWMSASDQPPEVRVAASEPVRLSDGEARPLPATDLRVGLALGERAGEEFATLTIHEPGGSWSRAVTGPGDLPLRHGEGRVQILDVDFTARKVEVVYAPPH